jgi:hypothetical protein
MRFLAFSALLAAGAFGCGQQAGSGNTKLASQDDSASYILGYKMGENLKQQSVPVKPEIIFRGLREGMEGKAAGMPDSVMQSVMMAFQVRMKVLQEGTGARPKATSQVTVHYKGTLLDGKQFDSSYDRGQPATFALNQVIPGWTEGVQLMNVGSKYQFWIPSDLGYGPQGSPPTIPPNSTLVFEVELLSFK